MRIPTPITLSSCSTPPSAQANSYRPEIDGLRALAVIAVIVNHFNHQILPSGYLGVDVFFVISGYVITSSLLGRLNIGIGEFLLDFYSRRVKRLLPALVVMVVLTALLIRLFDPNPQATIITGVVSFFGFSNIFLFYQATDYFGPNALLNTFSHTWSLGVEEQFYLVFPIFMYWQASRLRKKYFGVDSLSIALGALTVASLIAYATIYSFNQPASYFLMPLRFWELSLGCILASSPGITRLGRSSTIASTLLFGVLILELFIPQRFAILSTIAIVFTSVALIASLHSSSVAYKILNNKYVVYVGLISYSLYLWHWSVICLSRWTIGIHLWSAPLQIGLILALAAISYHAIERPARHSRWFSRGIGIGAGLAVSSAAAAIVMLNQKYEIPKFSGMYTADTGQHSPAPGYEGKHSHRVIDRCFASQAVNMKVRSISACTGSVGSSDQLVFVGDSHSMDLFPLSEIFYKEQVADVVNVFQPGCRTPKLPSEPEECSYLDKLIEMVTNKENTILIIRNNYSPRRIDGTLKSFAASLETLLQRTSHDGLRVVYFAGAPKYYAIGPGSLCSIQWFRPAWALDRRCHEGFVEPRSEQEARRTDLLEYLGALQSNRADFFVFDPFPILCGSDREFCNPRRGGRLLYRDNSHLTEEGSEILFPAFEEFLVGHGLLNKSHQTHALMQ